MPIDVAVLDVDGTVATCPYDFDAMRAAVHRVAARWAVDSESFGVRGIIEQIELGAQALGERGDRFRQEAAAAVEALELDAARRAEPIPGAGEALVDLRRRGVAVALITRNCRAAMEIVLGGLDGYDLLLTREDVPRAKPDPDHVSRCLVALGGRPERAVVVGDHTYDMEAGRAAGVRLCIGVRTGGSSAEELRAAGADDVIPSLADLPGWLEAAGEFP